MDLPMWEFVYLAFILAMALPMAGVAFGVRCYKGRIITLGKTSVAFSVILSLVLSAFGVHELIVLLGTEGNNIYLVWFGFWGPFVVMDFVYLRMMLFTKWAKRMMGTCKNGPSPKKKPRKVMTVDDIGKNWEKRIPKEQGPEEE